MKKTIINTGGALAIAGLSAGLSICSNEAQAADPCIPANVVNILTGANADLNAAATLTTGITYFASAVCTPGGDVTVPDGATVTIVDSAGMDFASKFLSLGKGATVNYYCKGGSTCKIALAGPATSATFNVAGPAITLLTGGTNADKITINANTSPLVLTGPATVTSTLAVPALKVVTLVTITTIPTKIAATGQLITSTAATTLTGK
ncbi:MAG: hypothetical protein J0G29_05235 [Alphaproteobacteria bacterium]|nr:hypothetical protein [Alphaproteobacteria bacterium]OJV45158.1 MAG: hypothetical protein BGO28_04015 [Alphaproteobacteria bacterium 43-37]